MQGPQAFSRILAPDSIKDSSSPEAARFCMACLEPAETVRLLFSLTFLLFNRAETIFRSRNDELVQLPMQTWSTGVPSSSLTALTLSGLWGNAINGSTFARSYSR